jgi:2-hydroxy-3-oxopropionate reductase
MRVGFIGLGVMGRPMAHNLVASGLDVVVHSRSAGPVDELVEAGASRAGSPRAVVEATDTIVLMLPDDAAVGAVVEGDDGVLSAALGGRLVIDMSTVSPTLARRIGPAVEQAGGAFLDAPVSGGDVGAREATLSIMVGGPAEAFERAQPVFQKLGRTIVHVGPTGAGQVVKACNQVVVALNIEALAEALVLGSKAGVDPATIVSVLSGGLAASRVMELRGPNMLEHRFDPGFAIDLHHKDLGIALSTARAAGVSLPATALVDQMLESLRQRGHGDRDHSALLTYVEELAAHTIGETS